MTEQLYSHPDKLLATHLQEVAEASKIIAARHQLDGATLTRLDELVRLHDFGKAIRAFQDYICYQPSPQKWPGRKEEKAHTPLGMFASGLIRTSSEQNEAWLLHLGSSVLGHHTQLPTRSDINRKLMDGSAVFKKQLHDLPLEELEQLTGFTLSAADFTPRDETIFAVINVYDEAFEWIDTLPVTQAVRERLYTQRLFSVLLEADKAFLALSEKARTDYASRTTRVVSPEVVELYLENARSSPVNRLRQMARQDALRQLSQHPDKSLFTLTLPTGLGKTLTAASLALTLRQQQARQIILVSPFLSIIDQTAKVYQDVLGEPGTDLLMQSHSLSDREYLDLEDGDASFFLDTWQSDVVVTTFDQVLLALFSSSAKHQMRFHHLADAIIVFDEVQALPSQLWDITQQALSSLTETFGSTVIAMSATQPGFIDGATELIPNVAEVFQFFGRYQLTLKHKQDLPLTDFTEMLLARQAELSRKRVLITLNTRRSARYVYDELSRLWKNPSCPIYFLSADVTPKDRLAVIDALKENDAQPCVVISTQVIEAGVDIDMDLVLRDFAPLDSLIQIAGRCNRNDLKPRCAVEIYTLVNNKGKRYCDLVYRTGNGPDISLQETRKVVEDHETILEEDVLELAEDYFAAIRRHKNLGQAHTQNWAYFREHLSVSKLLRGDQDKQYQFVVTERDNGTPDLETAVKNALNLQDRWEKRRVLRKLAPRLAQVTVNVWEKRGFTPENIAYPIGLFWFVRKGFYDPTRGLDIGVGHSDDANFL